ncbi:hypothetical protein AB0M86_45390 [Streptomyces sp. NPDC051639]|uniref:hypothetical protein n=1 Tax=Streptomyces sp. NPDC051639 TaxID=3155671 RepID=UPI00343221B0
MPARLSAVTLRIAMESVTGETATVTPYATHLRVAVPAPADAATYRALLDIVGNADYWGSTDATGQPCVWASVVTGGES